MVQSSSIEPKRLAISRLIFM